MITKVTKWPRSTKMREKTNMHQYTTTQSFRLHFMKDKLISWPNSSIKFNECKLLLGGNSKEFVANFNKGRKKKKTCATCTLNIVFEGLDA